ncbi:MAG: protein kinase, partial [Betaproteobacteria bacterium]|nr:protein kinase [Betaproteobacteria bacterium]
MPETTTYRNALPLDSMLLEYRLESVLGAGGFGMTYLGRDTHLEKHVAIKEYLPVELAVRALDGSIVPVSTDHQYNYQWGLERFIQEARTLAKFSHPNIVRVNRYFEANGTGYMVMDYEKGESLNQMLKRAPFPDEAALKAILMPLLEGLEAVHAAGFLHRDIKPSNIFIRENGNPVLLDFGAARQAVGGATRSLTSVLTPGYAPLEQYASDGHQGPWSDVYAMSGVLYRALVNENPPDAVSRMRDDTVLQALEAARGRYGSGLINAIAWGMALDEKRRPQSVAEWKGRLLGAAPAGAATRTAAARPAAPSIHAAPTVITPRSAPSIADEQTHRLARGTPRRSKWRLAGIGLALLAVVGVAAMIVSKRAADRAAHEPVVRSTPPAGAVTPKPVAEQPLRQRPVTGDARTMAPAREGSPPLRAPSPGAARTESPRVGEAGTERPHGLGREEFGRKFPGLAAHFDQIDANHDGIVTREEMVAFRERQA